MKILHGVEVSDKRVREKKRGPAIASPLDKNTISKLICLLAGCRHVGVFLLETFDAARGVYQLLLASEKWVAIRANFDAQHFALDGGTSLKRVSASAVNGYGVIIGVDTGLHKFSLCRVRSAR
jgi:hypothetical protein